MSKKTAEHHQAMMAHIDTDGYVWLATGGRSEAKFEVIDYILYRSPRSINDPLFDLNAINWPVLATYNAGRGYKTFTTDQYGNTWFFWQNDDKELCVIYDKIRGELSGEIVLHTGGTAGPTANQGGAWPDDFRFNGPSIISESDGVAFHRCYGTRSATGLSSSYSGGMFYMKIVPIDMVTVSDTDFANGDNCIAAYRMDGGSLPVPHSRIDWLNTDCLFTSAAWFEDEGASYLSGIQLPIARPQNTTVSLGQLCVQNGHMWVCKTAGTTANTAVPSEMNTSASHRMTFFDGTVEWQEVAIHYDGRLRSYYWGACLSGSSGNYSISIMVKAFPTGSSYSEFEGVYNNPTSYSQLWNYSSSGLVHTASGWQADWFAHNGVDKIVGLKKSSVSRSDGEPVYKYTSVESSDGITWTTVTDSLFNLDKMASPNMGFYYYNTQLGAPTGAVSQCLVSINNIIYFFPVEVSESGWRRSAFAGHFSGLFMGAY